jgi:protocatechuate 3,4-dioxygenase beta subunit
LTTNVLTYNLSGAVRHQGLPVAGVIVSLYDPLSEISGAPSPLDNLISQQTTGNRGDFTFAVRPGKYRIEVQPDTSTRFIRHTLSEVQVTANTICNVGLTTGSIISGKVGTTNGVNVRSGEVVALGIEPSSYRASAILEEDGSYTLTLPKGRYHLAFRTLPWEYLSERDPSSSRKRIRIAHDYDDENLGEAFIATSIAVLNVSRDDTFNLTLPEFVTYEGDVTDIYGQPVRGAKITVKPSLSQEDQVLQELALSATALTNRTGKFAIKLQPGIFDIIVTPDESVHLFGLEDKKVTVNKDTHYNFQVAEGFRVFGEVLYDEKPLSQCLVRISGVEHDVELITKTDNKGEFSAGLPAGEYKIIVSAHPKHGPTVDLNGSEYAGLAPWTRMVTVNRDAYIAAVMEEGTALYGIVKDEQGQPRAGVSVSAFPEAPRKTKKSDHMSGALSSATTNGEGRYCIFLSSGVYWIAVHTDVASVRKVEIQSEPVQLNIDWHGWCQLRFEITGDDGHPIPRCRVGYGPFGALEESEKFVEEVSIGEEASEPQSNVVKFERSARVINESELPRGYLLTSDEGVCQITLPAGIYSLRFNPPQEGSYSDKSIRQLSVSGDTTKHIRLPLKKVLTETESTT